MNEELKDELKSFSAYFKNVQDEIRSVKRGKKESHP